MCARLAVLAVVLGFVGLTNKGCDFDVLTSKTKDFVASGLIALMNSPAFLRQVNTAVQSQIPDTVEVNESVQVKQSGVELSAKMTHCTGLKSIQIKGFSKPNGTDAISRDSNGDMLASLSADVEIGGITCGGKTRAEVSAFFLNQGFDSEMSATMNVGQLVLSVSGTLVPGSGLNAGNMCLVVSDFNMDVEQDDITWSDVNMGFPGIPLSLPDSLVDSVWNRLPLDAVIGHVEAVVSEAIHLELSSLPLCV